MPTMFTLHITCPHCEMHHEIEEWPHDQTPQDILFTCQPKRGGCGRAAVVQVPESPSSVEHVFVLALPLTTEQREAVERYVVRP